MSTPTDAQLPLTSNAVLVPAVEPMQVIPDDPEASMRDVTTIERVS